MGLFRKSKIRIIAKFLRTDLVICSHSREGKKNVLQPKKYGSKLDQRHTVRLFLENRHLDQMESQQDGSYERSQHMVSMRNKEKYHQILPRFLEL